ncbi:MAG: hypothetical protein AAF215_11460 [Cyanobacteria bacterium P01_A01_bin.123]
MQRQSRKNAASFDHKLFFTFFMGMGLQMLLPINGISRIVLAGLWAGILIKFAIQHRQKYRWQWQGLTPLNLFKSLGTLIFGLWCFIPYTVAAVDSFIYNQDLEITHPLTTNPLKIFSEFIRILPDLLISKSPVVMFCIIPFFGLIFQMMVSLKIAYGSEGAFLDDCYQEQLPSVQYPKEMADFPESRSSESLIKKLIGFFTSRAFVVQKQSDSIRIEFYKISSQDLQENFAIICVPLMFFLFALYGLVVMVVFGLSDYLNDPIASDNLFLILPAWGFQVLFFTAVVYFIWSKFLYLLFAKVVLSFDDNNLTAYEILFGYRRQVFGIEKSSLSPLREQERSTKVPGMKNAALMIQRRGKDVELAGHLLPEAMETVQQVYTSYRTSTFNRFYAEIQPVYLL